MAIFRKPKARKKTAGTVVVLELAGGRYSVSLPSEGGVSYLVANETKARILENAELTINPNLDVEWIDAGNAGNPVTSPAVPPR